MKRKLKIFTSWLIVIYAFLLPWQAVYIFDPYSIGGNKSQFLTGQLYASELILWLIFISYLAGSFSLSRFKNDWSEFFRRDRNRSFFILSLWLFLGYCGLSIIWAANHQAAFYLWFHLLEAAALLLIILTSSVSKIKILWALTLAASFQGLLALQQFLTQTISADKWLGIAQHSAATLGDIVIETADGRWLRAYGSFSHPNILGGFLVLGLIAATALWLHYFRSTDRLLAIDHSIKKIKFDFETKKFIKLWLKLLLILILTIFMSAGLFTSFSRSAWLALAFAGLVFIFSHASYAARLSAWRERIQLLFFPCGIILAFAAFILIFNPLVQTRADFSMRLENRSGHERISQINEAVTIIKRSPFWGTGMNNYTVELNKIFPDRSAYELQPAHDIFLMIAAELGLIGLIIFLTLLGSILFLLRSSANKFWLATPLLACLIVGLFDHYLWTTYAGVIIFWLSLTLAVKYDNLSNHE